MTDSKALIERLNAFENHLFGPEADLVNEAADHIEELDRHLTLSGKVNRALSERIKKLEAELMDAQADNAIGVARIAELEADKARLCEALQLAANRLERNAVDYIAAGDPHSYEQSEWADEARRAALQGTSHDA